MPNINNLQSYNFQENPFMGMIGGGQQSQMSQQPAQQVNGQMENGKPIPNQLERGQTGDKSQPIMSAIQQLNRYVAESTDRDEIRTVRGLITVLTELLAREQRTMMQE